MIFASITSRSTDSDLMDEVLSNLRLSESFQQNETFHRLCIEAAIDAIEGRAGTYIHTVTGEVSSPSFSGDLLDCPIFPLNSITGIKIDDVALDASSYAMYGQYIKFDE